MLTLDLTINGLIIGVFWYALMAIGLSLIFGILKVVNFAHGEFYTVGAYAYTLVALALACSPWLALPFAFLVGVILGLVVERLLMRPLYPGDGKLGVMKDEMCRHHHLRLVAVLINLVRQDRWPLCLQGSSVGRHHAHGAGPNSHQRVIDWLSQLCPSVSSSRLRWSCAILLGPANPGSGAEPAGSLAAGIDPAKASAIVFALAGGAWPAISGALLANIFNPTPDVGVFRRLVYVIVVLGGMGSLPGSIVASLILGVPRASAASTSPINIATPSVW